MITTSDFIPPLITKIIRKVGVIFLQSQLKNYLSDMGEENILRNKSYALVGNASADPTEFYTHYDAFSYWIFKKIGNEQKKILDVGSPKIMVSSLSANNQVTSLVLADCKDTFSEVLYIYHDVADPLPLPDASFNCLTSTVALPLIGLGRYGDKLDPNCLHNFLIELDRVMMPDSDLYVSMCLGPDFLSFNNGWFLELNTIKELFKGWELIEAIVDLCASSKSSLACNYNDRFVDAVTYGFSEIKQGDYRVVFCHFYRRASTRK